MRIVSPTPSASRVPRPTADFSEPDHLRAALGDARGAADSRSAPASRRLAAIVLGTLVDLIDTLKFSKSRSSIISTNSTAAVTSASTGSSRSSSCRCFGSEPELTPMRIGDAGVGRAARDLGDLLAAADVARVQADAVRARVDRLQRERVVEVDVGDHRNRRARARSLAAPRRPCRAARRPAPARSPPRPCGRSARPSPRRRSCRSWSSTARRRAPRRRPGRRRPRSGAWRPRSKPCYLGPCPCLAASAAFARTAAHVDFAALR